MNDGYELIVGMDIYNEANPNGTTVLQSVAGCDSVVNVNLIFNSVDVSINVQEPACFGETGFLTANPTGSSPFSYNWSNSATTQTTSTTNVGTYTVIVTDTHACTATASAMMTSPSEIVVSISTTDASCGQNDGMASVVATGGIPPYTYSWNDGQTTATAINLPAGTYSVTVTDANGCMVQTSASISDSSVPTALVAVFDATCGLANGSVILNLSLIHI